VAAPVAADATRTVELTDVGALVVTVAALADDDAT